MIPEFNKCRACDDIFDVLKEPLCTNCATTIISERDELEAENAALRTRVGRLQTVASAAKEIVIACPITYFPATKSSFVELAKLGYSHIDKLKKALEAEGL
jgi:hypothetical protein